MRAWKANTIAAVMTLSASAQSVDAGRRQFVLICAGCHGEDGSGAGHTLPWILTLCLNGYITTTLEGTVTL